MRLAKSAWQIQIHQRSVFSTRRADLLLHYSTLTVNKIVRDRCMSPWITVFTSKRWELICHVSSAVVTNHISMHHWGWQISCNQPGLWRISSTVSTCPVQTAMLRFCQLTHQAARAHWTAHKTLLLTVTWASSVTSSPSADLRSLHRGMKQQGSTDLQ